MVVILSNDSTLLPVTQHSETSKAPTIVTMYKAVKALTLLLSYAILIALILCLASAALYRTSGVSHHTKKQQEKQ